MIKVGNGHVELSGSVTDLVVELATIAEEFYKSFCSAGIPEEEAEKQVMAVFKAGITVAREEKEKQAKWEVYHADR